MVKTNKALRQLLNSCSLETEKEIMEDIFFISLNSTHIIFCISNANESSFIKSPYRAVGRSENPGVPVVIRWA